MHGRHHLYFKNCVFTAPQIFIEGCMPPCSRRLRTLF